MIKKNLQISGVDFNGLIVTPSECSPAPAIAFRALSDMERPFILGGAPCPGFRYSVVGAAPFMSLTARGQSNNIEVKNAPENIRKLLRNQQDSSLFTTLSAIMQALKKEQRAEKKSPFPFNGGAVGFFSYDLGNELFKLQPADTNKHKKNLGLPLTSIGFYDNIYVYDHDDDKGYIVSCSPETEYAEKFFKQIEGASAYKLQSKPLSESKGFALTSNTTKAEYMEAVTRAKEYISSGDIYQINLSQRLSTPFTGETFALYEALIKDNPTPFSSFFDCGEFQLISNSPERLLRINGEMIETCPIKGTRPRGKTPADDEKKRRELAQNTKERAEHVMIVDLERNDLGRIALPGSVYVDKFEEIKTFSKLHHMVSVVRGTAPAKSDPFNILKNIFPGGSITGAPKIRAMEIIEELESVPRELYTGGAGFIDYCGDMDLSILIRTAVVRDNQLHLHVGGGIVADSDPEAEYDESILKAMDFLSILKKKPDSLLK